MKQICGPSFFLNEMKTFYLRFSFFETEVKLVHFMQKNLLQRLNGIFKQNEIQINPIWS